MPIGDILTAESIWLAGTRDLTAYNIKSVQKFTIDFTGSTSLTEDSDALGTTLTDAAKARLSGITYNFINGTSIDNSFNVEVLNTTTVRATRTGTGSVTGKIVGYVTEYVKVG